MYVATMPAVDDLALGRASCARGAWREANAALLRADRPDALDGAHLELLAMTEYMLGDDERYLRDLERAHHRHLDADDPLRAARVGCWLGMQLAVTGQTGRASGWLGRAQRLVERHAEDCVERGYLLLPLAFRLEAQGDLRAAAAAAGDAAAAGERFGDQDLLALGLHMQGHLLVLDGHVAEGLPLLDEAMVAVTAGELSPIVSGIVYCGVIVGCQAAYEPQRAQEWTAALARWCEAQPDMVAFSGTCHVHRAEIMQLKGAWSDALEEARCATRRAELGGHRHALAEAAYRQGEVHRLRGAVEAAEAAYRDASGYGREPQPGLALLRLQCGDVGAACAAIGRIVEATPGASDRARLLPAYVEIMLAAGDLEAARRGADELAQVAAGHAVGVLPAVVAQARGAVELAQGEPRAALPALREAWRVWEACEAPYEAARVRALIGAACRALGDEDSAALELDAARRSFEQLGAAPDAARLEAVVPAGGDHGLSARELQVLRLVAAGRTNKAIAAELVISERTVDRHVSNIFAKLRVSSRAAATARAYEQRLV
jgi:DNA-binding CsgD family transcriptional regulator